MYACLLLRFISMFFCLDLGFAMHCALRGLVLVDLWGHLLVWLHSPILWLVGCDRLWDTSPWCWCTWYTPFSTPCDDVILALLALCNPFGFLCFFAFLHTFLHVHAWVYVSSILHSYGTINTRSKPTYVLLGHPLLFDNIFVFPHLAFFHSFSFSVLSF